MSQRPVQQTVYEALDPTSLVQRIAGRALGLVDAAERVTVLMLYDGVLRVVASSRGGDPSIGREFPVRGATAGELFRRRATLCSDDVRRDERVLSGARLVGDTRSMILVPLFGGERPIGMLSVSSTRVAAFTGEDVSTVSRIGDFAGVVIAASRETAAAARTAMESLAGPLPVVEGDGTTHLHHGDAQRVGEFLAEMVSPGSVPAARTRERVAATLREGALRCVVQPLVDLRDGSLLAAEALARFDHRPRRGPDLWFAEAHSVGAGVALETLAVQRALAAFELVPELPTLGINVGYDMLVSGALPELLRSTRPERIVLELTEHVVVEDYGRVRRAIDELRLLGVRLAIDDVGAGYSSLRHIAELAPEAIKLDHVFIERAAGERSWSAMAGALVDISAQLGASLVAEGIETEAHYLAARELGIEVGQGHLIARPAAPEEMPWCFEHVRTLAARPRLEAV